MSATHPHAGIPANIEIKAEGTVTSYREAMDFLGGDYARTLASNVMVRRPASGDYVAIVLYRTEIIRYYADNQTFSVDNGGFNTPTTASRVSQFTPNGYHACHYKKKMQLNGRPTGHTERFSITRVSN